MRFLFVHLLICFESVAVVMLTLGCMLFMVALLPRTRGHERIVDLGLCNLSLPAAAFHDLNGRVSMSSLLFLNVHHFSAITHLGVVTSFIKPPML